MTSHVETSTLALFREGVLAAAEAASVRAHLAACPHCRDTETQLGQVTDLLAAAPAEPIPARLSARIEAALAAEAAARSATTVPAPSSPPAGVPDVTMAPPGGAREAAEPGAAEPGAAGRRPAPPGGAPGRLPGPGHQPGHVRPRRSGTGPGGGRPPRQAVRAPARSRARLRALAVAAVIAVVGGGGYAVAQFASQSGGQSSAGSAASQPRAPVPGGQSGGADHAVSRGPAFRPVASGTDYTAGRFTSQVRAVLRRYPAGTAARRSGAGERSLPSGGLARCVTAVTGGQRARLVDVARYQGRPAVIIVVSGGTSAPARAWAVGRDCSAARPDVLARTSLPPAG